VFALNKFTNINNIAECSIVLMNGKTKFSKLIRFFSPRYKNDTFTHAGIYFGGPKNLLCHQVGYGTALQPAKEEFDACYDVSIWTNKTIPNSTLNKIKTFCLTTSKPYDFKEIKSMAVPWIKRSNGLICTELVLQIFKNSGFPIMGNTTAKVSPSKLQEILEKDVNWKLAYKISDGIENI
jgi:hypothetical protein